MSDMNVKLGYARVSTEDQNLDAQRGALGAAGCSRIFEDHGISGQLFERPGLAAAVEAARRGDTLVVVKLDRLGRSLANLLTFVQELEERGVHFQSLGEQIDTHSAGGRFMFHVLGALSEFERSVISERTRAGLEAARARGTTLGRPPKLDPDLLENALVMRQAGVPVAEVSRRIGVDRTTLWRHLKAQRR